MIALLLLACAAPAGDDTATASVTDNDDDATTPAPAPTGGTYEVQVAGEWDGDCRFDDKSTEEPPDQEWSMDPRGDALVIYPNYWEVEWCSLSGMDFSCDLGSWRGNRMQVDHVLEGTFTDDAFTGAMVIDLDCSDSGCDTLQYYYGSRLDFPCHAEAAVEGVLVTAD